GDTAGGDAVAAHRKSANMRFAESDGPATECQRLSAAHGTEIEPCCANDPSRSGQCRVASNAEDGSLVTAAKRGRTGIALSAGGNHTAGENTGTGRGGGEAGQIGRTNRHRLPGQSQRMRTGNSADGDASRCRNG